MEIYIVTGFTGTGKTTFLNKYIPLFPGRTAVIENELGEMKLSPELSGEGNLVSELPSGCICCTLAVNLEEKLTELEERGVERVYLEPSGVSRLSDIMRICERNQRTDIGKESKGSGLREVKKITLVDISVFEGYLEDFGEFYTDQIENADVIFLSCIDEVSEEERERGEELIREMNPDAALYTEDWRTFSENELAALFEKRKDRKEEQMEIPVMTGISDRGVRKKREIGIERTGRKILWRR